MSGYLEDILPFALQVGTQVSNVQAQRFQVLLLKYQRVESVALACFELALVDDSSLSLILFIDWTISMVSSW